ncbi:MAG: PHP domain-containing protein [Caldisericaceae bacterium]
MINWEIYQRLLDIKTLFELEGKSTEASLYEQSAYSIAALEYPIETSLDRLYFLPRFVKEDIEEMLNGQECTTRESLEKVIPKSLRAISRIPGLRADDAKKIYESISADSIDDIKNAVDSGKISAIFGERFENELRRRLFEYQKDNRSLNLFDSFSYAKSIIMSLEGYFKIELAGSVRRGKEITENIDFVVLANIDEGYEKIMNVIPAKRCEREREDALHLRDKYGNLLNFYFADAEFYYSKLQYYTGSKLHNRALAEIAKAKGFKIAKRGYILVGASSEEEFYEKLGMKYIPPEVREGEDEIELAEKGSLPKLVEAKDIKGDLHVHSDFSDGTNSIYELKDETAFLGYDYFAVTDHSSSLKIANGLSHKRLLREIEIIDKINSEKSSPYILKGTETEINDDGSIDTSSEERGRLDLVVGALHSFSQRSAENTERIVKAMKNNLINTLAHPTGRIINVRESIAIDFDKVCSVASSSDTALEVNLFPNRIDLSSNLVKQALSNGVKRFTVGTDAHSAGHLHFMEYGLKILRRAWLLPENILNTFELEELKKTLWMKKH